MGNVRLRTWSQVAAVAFIILTVSAVPGAFALSSHAEATFPASTWNSWASVAWGYLQTSLKSTTGMTADACAPPFNTCWAYFTYWGLASNIFGVVDAHELGLISDSSFLGRVNPILTSLNSISLDPNTKLPYGVYSRDTLQQATGSPPFDTNAADYGRYLIAMYVLRQHLLQRGFTTQANQVTSAVSRVTGNSKLAGTLGYDLYSYYASLGFMLWGINPSATSSAQSGFQNLMQNGPFVDPSSMYGVSGIPTNTRIDGEPFIDAILEVGNVALVTSLPSWCNFLQLSQKVYSAQEARSVSTGKPEFWTGGGLDFAPPKPGFVSEWIVYPGATWVTLDQSGNTFTDPLLPVAYVKLAFAYNALYGTTYTSNFLNAHATSLETATYGFGEGIYANGANNKNAQIQTQQILLSSAVMATLNPPSPDFCLYVVPASTTIAPGATASYTVTGVFLGGFSSPVTLSATPPISDATFSFTPQPITPPSNGNQSTFQIITTQSVKRGTFTITVTGTSGAITHTATVLLTIITPLSLLSTVLLTAPANSVYFIFPDGNTAHKKPTGVGYASVTDWTALGFVYGSLTNMPQFIALDTNSAYIDQSTGAPMVSDKIIVLFGGPLVNEVVHYYESHGIALLHWVLVGGFVSGTEYYVNRQGQTVAGISLSVLGPESQDMGLIEAFTDQNGNTVIIFSGFGWKGTFVSGVYFKTVLISQLSTMPDSWYIYSWSDSNGNGFADVSEVNPMPVNHGN